MKHFLLTEIATGIQSFAMAEDTATEPSGYDLTLYTFMEFPGEPTEQDSLLAAFQDDTVQAQAWALEKIEDDAERATSTQVRRLRRQVAVMELWNEVQRLKLMQATNNIPADLTERAKQLPFIMALVQQSGNTLTQVATAIENRLWDRVRNMAAAEAKLLLGHDNVRAATTVQGKVDAANNIIWS